LMQGAARTNIAVAPVRPAACKPLFPEKNAELFDFYFK